MGSQPITIFWKNFRGETVYTENRTLADVMILLEEDERALNNRYALHNYEIVDDMQLRDWYVSQMQAGTVAA